MEQPKFHARIFYVKGLNIGKEPFVWNDKLFIKDAGTEEGNLAEVRIFIDRPIPEFDDESVSEREGILIISVFLACFRLVNKNLDLVLDQTENFSYSVYDIEDFKSNNHSTKFYRFNSDLPKHPENNCREYLKNTIPLFEKVIEKIDFKQKNRENPLSISLPLFQKIQDNGLESIIDYVTILESLVCENEGELKFKFALRTTLLVEKNLKERKSTFESLKEIYNYRSKLVHGSDISLNLLSEDDDYGAILWLESICKRALLEYIELVSAGLSKKDIIKKLDSTALGIPDDQ